MVRHLPRHTAEGLEAIPATGAKRFLARKAWKLAYASQHVAPGFDRLCAQRDRLLAKKLKSDDPDYPLKPKGMRWSTYERHLDKLNHMNTAMDVALIQRFGMTAEAILNNAGNLDRKEGKDSIWDGS